MRVLSESQVRKCLSIRAAVDANRKALGALRSDDGGGALVPTRIGLPYHDNDDGGATSCATADWTLFKPAAYYPPRTIDGADDDAVVMGAKCISMRAGNPARGLPGCPASVVVTDARTGRVDAVVAATYLTAVRTAAGSAAATELLTRRRRRRRRRPRGDDLVVFGAGLQAEFHVRALRETVPTVRRVVLINRARERAEDLRRRLSEDVAGDDVEVLARALDDRDGVEEAVRRASILVTATNSSTPLFPGEWAPPGCHVVSVGSYTPDMTDLDQTLVDRCRVVLDTREGVEVGDFAHLRRRRQANNDDHDATWPPPLLGDLLAADDDGTTETTVETSLNERTDCTLYKSVGTAIQDVVTAHVVLKKAVELDIGTVIDMD